MAVLTEVAVLAAVAGVTVLLARLLSNYLHFRKLELAIPGPPSLFLLGNALDLVFVTPDVTLKTFLGMVGGRREMCRFSVFNNLMVSVQDPGQIEELLRCKKFDDKSVFFYSLLHVVAKRGLVPLNGPEWKAHRKWLDPAFNLQVLNGFLDVFSEEAKAYVDRVEVGKEVNVVDNLRKTIVRNILRTSMSADASQHEDEAMDVFRFMELFLRTLSSRSFNPVLWSDRVFLLTPLGRQVGKVRQKIDAMITAVITKQREERQNNKNYCDSERPRKTLVDIMLEDPDPSTGMPEHVDDEAILDEIKTFFGAGVETTVSTLAWLLKVLSLLPEVQEQVHAELVSVFGDSDRDISHGDVRKLLYLPCVIKETMRMFPAAPFVIRQCYAETALCGHTIPAGTTLFLNYFAAHRDPEHWDQPDVFDPERFLPERSKGRHPYSYMPFSLGPRRCIAGHYAMMNMTVFVATVLRAFQVLPVGDHKDLQSLADNMTFDLSSHLVGGTRVKFQRRGTKAA